MTCNLRRSDFEAQNYCVSAVGLTNNKKQEDWFADNHKEIKDILDKKHKAFQAVQSNLSDNRTLKKYNEIKHGTRHKIRHIKNQWWIDKAQEIQRYADQHDQRQFFEAIKKAYGVTHRKSCPLKDKYGNLIKDQNQIKNRWREHYITVLNQHTEIDYSALESIPQYEVATSLESSISLEEIQRAIGSLKNNKSPGADQIPGEVFKSLLNHQETMEHFKALFNLIWTKGEVPQDFRDSYIINLFKNKGSAAECGNYRGISLLSIGGKILAKVMATRLLKYVDQILPETQSGFRPKRGTTDLIFTLKQLQEKAKEQQSQIYVAFIDLAKAFDSINRKALWQIMGRFGIPPKFLKVCESLHENNYASVLIEGEPSEPFLTQTGVRQGCVLAPILFNIFVTALAIMVDTKLEERGVAIKYRFDSGLFNIKRFRAKTRVKYLTDLQYADDCGLIALSVEILQAILETYTWAYEALGLKINIEKTKIMTTPATVDQTEIHVQDNPLEYVDHFNYLGSIVNTKGNIDEEIEHRIKSATGSFWKLRARVFDNHDLNLSTKTSVYRSVIIPALTYSCETWVPYKRHIRALERIQQRQLRQIMHIKWFHKVSNAQVLQKAGCKSIAIIVAQARLRWAGHVARMSENRLPKCVLYGELAEGRRKQGGQLKRYKDVLHETLKSINIQDQWEELAQDRNRWRNIIATYSEPARPGRIRQNTQENFECPDCGRVITSRIGLFSHRKTHQR